MLSSTESVCAILPAIDSSNHDGKLILYSEYLFSFYSYSCRAFPFRQYQVPLKLTKLTHTFSLYYPAIYFAEFTSNFTHRFKLYCTTQGSNPVCNIALEPARGCFQMVANRDIVAGEQVIFCLCSLLYIVQMR